MQSNAKRWVYRGSDARYRAAYQALVDAGLGGFNKHQVVALCVGAALTEQRVEAERDSRPARCF